MWITDFRKAFGLELDQLGQQIRKLGARQEPPLRVSDVLLYRLETDPNFRTVPKLADLIAEACGATARQRDALVLKKYRGTWTPPKRRRAVKPAPPKPVAAAPAPPPPRPAPPRNNFHNPREVVQIDRNGVEMARFRSCNFAAVHTGVTENQVTRRCHRRHRSDEYKGIGYTFRFAAEWDAMTAEQRRQDVARLNGVGAERGGSHGAKMVTVISRHGRVAHYDAMQDAAAATGVTYAVFQHRLNMAQDRRVRVAELDGVRFMFTSEWDSLDEALRAELTERGVSG